MRNRIKHFRTLYKLSQEELGARVGKTKGQISKLENMIQDPTLHELSILATALSEVSGQIIQPWHLIVDNETLDRFVSQEEEYALVRARRSLSEAAQKAYDQIQEGILKSIKSIQK